MAAGMPVLDIEHRIVLRLLEHLGEIEIKHGVVPAEQHHEPHGVGTNLVDHLAQRDEIARAFRHPHLLAGTQQANKLHHLDVERGLAVTDALHGRLHAFDVAAMIGAEHVDHVEEAAIDLVLMIGDVGGEIGVGAVRFDQRTIDVIAIGGGTEQRLDAVLVILDRLALRGRQAALVDVALGTQEIDGLGDLVVAGLDQRPLREEHVVLDVQRREIALDHVHHHGDRLGANDRQPGVFRHRLELVAMLGGERLPDRHEIVPRIQPFRDLADVFAKRFAITQEGRACEYIDLRAGVVDVIFARDVVASKIKQAAQRVAEHRAAAMADMHRSGRIGRDVFDVDLGAVAERAFAVGRAFAQHREQFARPDLGLQGEIDEAGPGDLDGSHQIVGAQFFRDFIGEFARLCLRVLGEHHRGIGRHVAMGGIARRLDHDAGEIDAGGPLALGRERGADRLHARQHVGEQML